MDRRTFWATQPADPVIEAIVFEHPSIEPQRLVANVFEPVTLGGHEHTPAPMSIKPPEPSADGSPRLTLAFPRAVVGRQFKAALRQIQAAGSREPIIVRYSVYLGDRVLPQVTWLLYVSDQGGITFGPESVQVTATLSNPLRQACAPRYTPDVFTGLELIQ